MHTRGDTTEGEGEDDRAVTTCSIGYMSLAEEGKEDEMDAEDGTARGSVTLGRPIIVGITKKVGGVRARQVKWKGSGNPWIATRIAADIEELGYGGWRVVFKASQEVAIRRRTEHKRSAETVPVNSPVGESRSNGRVENAVQRVQLVRTLKDALERRLKPRIRSK